MDKSRANEPGAVRWTLSARIIIGGTRRNNLIAIAVGGIEDGASDVHPALDCTGAGAVIGAEGGMRPQHVEDGGRHVARKGKSPKLIINNGNLVERVLGVCHANRKRLHGLDEVVPIADDPAGAHDVVARAPGHGDVAGGLGLAVDGKRAERLLLAVHLGRAVENVVAGHMDERDAVPGAGGAGEQGRPHRVGLPGGHAALGGLGPVDASACPHRWRAPSRGSRCGCSRRRTTGRPPRPSRRSQLARRACAVAPACRWCRRRTEA